MNNMNKNKINLMLAGTYAVGVLIGMVFGTPQSVLLLLWTSMLQFIVMIGTFTILDWIHSRVKSK